MDYTTIKQLAKQLNCKVTDLIALAPQNDPFYVGTPGDWINGQWFASLWQDFGYTTGVHTRRVHYHIISQTMVVRLPNGLPYENTESCWNFLVQASKIARYLELGTFEKLTSPKTRSLALGGCPQTIFRDPAGA